MAGDQEMNYLPFCGYGFYGAASNQERAAYFCTWGLMATLPSVFNVVPLVMDFYRRLRG